MLPQLNIASLGTIIFYEILEKWPSYLKVILISSTDAQFNSPRVILFSPLYHSHIQLSSW